jgi:diaminohydroxyphosphoribosylaminopyrimidine deaminase / 5-amino-6-(5-phosphoribosylamino)uracil reductase
MARNGTWCVTISIPKTGQLTIQVKRHPLPFPKYFPQLAAMTPDDPAHLPYLDRCNQLARLPGAAVEPNPRVGALVVHAGRILGEGWHQQYGGPHAEVHAVAAVPEAERHLLAEATLYVSLEPCNHHGKTPPCTELILRHRIPRVVIGSLDPNPQMQGRSVAHLRAQGVEVIVAADQGPALALNRHFWTNQTLRRPHVTLKWAQSQDGFIAALDADGQPMRTAITGPEAARWVHRLRHEHQAILIGAGTALIDDPALTTRHWPGRDPVGILLDRRLVVPRSARLFGLPQVIVINDAHMQQDGHIRYLQAGASPHEFLPALYAAGIGSILVEGGAQVLSAFLAEGLWDEAFVLKGPENLGKGLSAPAIPDGMKQLGASNKPNSLDWVYYQNKG